MQPEPRGAGTRRTREKKQRRVVKIIEKGMYELFETNHHHQILVLNRRQWFALVRGQKGLEVDGHYEEWLLPNGLPTARDREKRVVLTNDTLSTQELEDYLKHPAPPARPRITLGPRSLPRDRPPGPRD